jgi:hypothetical protein
MKDIKKGDFLKCVNNANRPWWKQNKKYKVEQYNYGELFITDEQGDVRKGFNLDDVLNHQEPLKFELIKGENNMQELKVGDLVEVIENKSGAYKNKFERFKAGDKAVVTDVLGSNIRIGNNRFGNVIGIKEVKKVEQKPELTEYEEELVLRLAEKIKEKDMLERNMNNLMTEIQYREELATKTEQDIEEKQKEIKEIKKKLLTK